LASSATGSAALSAARAFIVTAKRGSATEVEDTMRLLKCPCVRLANALPAGLAGARSLDRDRNPFHRETLSMTSQDIFIEAGSLVVLSGLPGAGKSSLKARASGFRDLSSAWISTDALREQLLGAHPTLENGQRIEQLPQSANVAVHAIAREMVRARLAHGLTCIVDATNPTDADRRGWVELAQAAGVPAQVLIVDTPLAACLQANAQRARRVPEASIRAMHATESGEPVFASHSVHAHQRIGREARLVLRRPLLEHERYDVVGDVHGLKTELLALLARAGWRCEDGHLRHPRQRKLLFLGDLVDRGPDSVGVVRLVRQAVLSRATTSSSSCASCRPRAPKASSAGARLPTPKRACSS
jgi:predicted kinase